MRNLFFLIILLSFSITAEATCTYSGSEVTVNMSLSSKILSDNTLPAGSVLAVRTVGGNVSNMKSFSNCGTADVYAVVASPGAIEALGVKGIQGGKVYETGIPGIGYQISDAISGTNNRPIPAVMGMISAWKLTANPVSQVTIWLIKTTENIDTSKTSAIKISVSYLAGSVPQVQSNSSTARLLKINATLGPFTYKDTSCNVTPSNGSTVMLSSIEASQLIATSQGGFTGKQKNINLNISYPDSSTGTQYTYWFNPITENSVSIDGVLLNSISKTSGGAQNVGFIIKKGTSAIKFYDYTSYSIPNISKSQTITLTADYYKLSNTVTPGKVQAIFEIILQEN